MTIAEEIKQRKGPSGIFADEADAGAFFVANDVEFVFNFVDDPADESQSTLEVSRLIYPLPPGDDPLSEWMVGCNRTQSEVRPAWLDSFSISHLLITGYTTVFPDPDNPDIPITGLSAAEVTLGLSLLKQIRPPVTVRGNYPVVPDPVPDIIANPGAISAGSDLVNFPDAEVGDAVFISNNGVQTGLVFEGQVSAPGQVTFYVMNFQAAPLAVPPGGFDLSITVIASNPRAVTTNAPASVNLDLIFWKKGTELDQFIVVPPPP